MVSGVSATQKLAASRSATVVAATRRTWNTRKLIWSAAALPPLLRINRLDQHIIWSTTIVRKAVALLPHSKVLLALAFRGFLFFHYGLRRPQPRSAHPDR